MRKIARAFRIVGANRYNPAKIKRSMALKVCLTAPRFPAPERSEPDAGRWDALTKYDNEISAAAEKLRPYGEAWVNKLGNDFFALNEDRRYLPTIVDKLLAEAERDIALRWERDFRRTADGELCTEESLNLLREAMGVGYTLTVDDKNIFTLSKNSGNTHLRSNSDIKRIVPTIVRASKQ